jgi:amino acid adenylation domain
MYNISSVQKAIFSDPVCAKLSNYAFFHIESDFSAQQLSVRWEYIVANHAILRSALVYKDNLKFPLLAVAEKGVGQVVVLDAGGMDNTGMQKAAKDICFKQEGSISLVLLEVEGVVRYFALAAPVYLLDSYSIQLLAHQLTVPDLDLYDSLQYAQYVEWQESLEAEQPQLPAELTRVWQPVNDGKRFPLQVGSAINSIQEYNVAEIDISAVRSALTGLARTTGIAMPHLFWAIWNSVLDYYNNSEAWSCDFTSLGRDFDEFKKIPGPFSRMMPIRCTDNETIDSVKEKIELVESYREYYSSVDNYQNLSIAFEYLDIAQLPAELANKHLTCLDYLSHGQRVGLLLSVMDNNGDLSVIRLQYDKSVFNEAGISAMSDLFIYTVKQVCADKQVGISKRSIVLDTAGIDSLLTDSKGGDTTYPFVPLHEAFMAVAQQHPDNIALKIGDRSVLYSDLLVRSRSIAEVLMTKYGVLPGDRIVLNVARSEHFIAALLGTMMAGAVYVPIDTRYPKELVTYIVDNAQAKIVIMDGGADALTSIVQSKLLSLDNLVREAVAVNIEKDLPRWSADQLAYIIYTSGTTGKPKGCAISLSNLQHYIGWACSYYFKEPIRGNFPLFTSIAFDLTVTCIFTTLTKGACLHVFHDDEPVDESLRTIFNGQNDIDIVKLTPSHIRMLPHLGVVRSHVKACIVGGEMLLQDDIAILRSLNSDIAIYNEYGPTECTVGCTVWDVPALPCNITIGKPIDNTAAYILDTNMQPCLPGVEGELYIAGRTVGMGYYNNAEQTSSSFIKAAFCEGRLYKTGDLAYRDANGDIVYVGRNDDMVKVNGYRVETQGITDTVKKLEHIKEAYTTKRDKNSIVELITYYTADKKVTDVAIKEFLEKKLPAYMVPNYLIQVPKFELTANGKFNKAELPMPEDVGSGSASSYIAPTSEIEKILASIWEQVLHYAPVGIKDHFLAVGGDSIKAIQVTGKLRELGWKITVKDVLQFPTVEQLSEKITPLKAVLTNERGPEVTSIPLTPLQIKFFEENTKDIHHYNQSVLLKSSERIDVAKLEQVVTDIWKSHLMLRAVFSKVGQAWQQNIMPATEGQGYFIVNEAEGGMDDEEWIRQQTALYQSAFSLQHGPLFKCIVLKTSDEDAIFILAHHLIIDGVSWRVLLDEVHTRYAGLGAVQKMNVERYSYYDWSIQLKDSASTITDSERKYWKQIEDGERKKNVLIDKASEQVYSRYKYLNLPLSKERTAKLTAIDLSEWNTNIQEILLAALSKALYDWRGDNKNTIYLESHGRNSTGNADMYASAIGWFTVKYPFLLSYEKDSNSLHAIQSIKNALNAVPGEGEGYFLLKYLTDKSGLSTSFEPEFSFNYLGHIETPETGILSIHPLSDKQVNIGDNIYMAGTVLFTLVINSGSLQVGVTYHTSLYEEVEISRLQKSYIDNIEAIIDALHGEPELKQTQIQANAHGLDAVDMEELLNSLQS